MAESNVIKRPYALGMDTVAPYGVYVNYRQVASFDTEDQARAHMRQLRHQIMTPLERQKEKDRRRTALQAPISASKSCVMYLHERQERRTAWFYRPEHVASALQIVRARCGVKNATIYQD